MTRRRFPLTLLLAAVVVVAAVGPLGFGGGTTRAVAASKPSLTQLENELMCVACHESLAVAQSPESFSERQYIRDLIAQGESAAEIKRNMVEQYGQAVLAVPPASGFNLVVYVLPPVLIGIAVLILVLTVPKWRRRARQVAPTTAPAPLNPEDAQRLNEDLGRYA